MRLLHRCCCCRCWRRRRHCGRRHCVYMCHQIVEKGELFHFLLGWPTHTQSLWKRVCCECVRGTTIDAASNLKRTIHNDGIHSAVFDTQLSLVTCAIKRRRFRRHRRRCRRQFKVSSSMYTVAKRFEHFPSLAGHVFCYLLCFSIEWPASWMLDV